jgi:hypothetical protein
MSEKSGKSKKSAGQKEGGSVSTYSKRKRFQYEGGNSRKAASQIGSQKAPSMKGS